MTSTALLVMDVQQGIVDRFAGDEGYLPRLAAAVEAARGAGRQGHLRDGGVPGRISRRSASATRASRPFPGPAG